MAKNTPKDVSRMFSCIPKYNDNKIETKAIIETEILNNNNSNIDVSLIDFDERNEYLNGYEDIKLIEGSIKEIGMKSAIGVYRKNDGSGRYLCYSGHTRLKALVKSGVTTVPCFIVDEPDTEDEKLENLILLNLQRQRRPLYFARNLHEYEMTLRHKGIKDASGMVQSKFGISKKTYYRYMKILKLEERFQDLCKEASFPYTILVDNIDSLTDEQKDKLYDSISLFQSDDTITASDLKSIIDSITNNVEAPISTQISKENVKKDKPVYVDKMIQKINDLQDCNPSDIIRNKQRTLVQAKQLRDFLDKIIESCQK